MFSYLLCRKKKIHQINIRAELNNFINDENYFNMIRQLLVSQGNIPLDSDITKAKILLTQIANNRQFNKHLNELINDVMNIIEKTDLQNLR